MALESQIQRMILARLLDQQLCFWRCNTGVAATKTGYIRFGTPGQPDIQGCYLGRWVGIEVKTERGTLTPQQRAFRDRIHAAGGVYITARNWEDVTNELERLRIAARGTTPATERPSSE